VETACGGPAACGVLFFAEKVGGVRDPETKSLLMAMPQEKLDEHTQRIVK
jgi:hypothetical protein